MVGSLGSPLSVRSPRDTMSCEKPSSRVRVPATVVMVRMAATDLASYAVSVESSASSSRYDSVKVSPFHTRWGQTNAVLLKLYLQSSADTRIGGEGVWASAMYDA